MIVNKLNIIFLAMFLNKIGDIFGGLLQGKEFSDCFCLCVLFFKLLVTSRIEF